MAAKLEQYAEKIGSRLPGADMRPLAIVLPIRRAGETGPSPPEEASGPRIGPARGLALGLALGAALWAMIGLLTWQFFH